MAPTLQYTFRLLASTGLVLRDAHKTVINYTVLNYLTKLECNTSSSQRHSTLNVVYAKPNPSEPSRMAMSSFSRSTSSLGYSGRSSWLKQVCAEGSMLLPPNALWMLNCFTPSEPCSAWKPSSGT